MNNYPIGDFLIRLKNAKMASRDKIEVQWSNAVFAIGKLLERCQFVGKVSQREEKGKKRVEVSLKESPKKMRVQIISKPGRRFYVGANELPYPKQKGGLVIISTSTGIMSSLYAREKKIGGEVIAQVW